MGEPLYLCQPPTGYSDAASAWVNTGALVARLNFALALASNRIPGHDGRRSTRLVSRRGRRRHETRRRRARAASSSAETFRQQTRRTIENRIENPAATATPQDPSANTGFPLIAGLILGSPEFQRQ